MDTDEQCRRRGGSVCRLRLAVFLLRLQFDSEDGGNTCFRTVCALHSHRRENIKLSFNYIFVFITENNSNVFSKEPEQLCRHSDGLRTGRRRNGGLIPGMEQEYLFSQHPYRLWDPLGLLSNGSFLGVKRPMREAGHTPSLPHKSSWRGA
jgi:hypothetical protein